MHSMAKRSDAVVADAVVAIKNRIANFTTRSFLFAHPPVAYCARAAAAYPPRVYATLAMPCCSCYKLHVIKSFANRATERFATDGKSKFTGMDASKAMLRLKVLHAASALEDIPPLKSVGLHPLVGGRQGQWAMTINGPWRLVFRFKDGNAEDVEIVDYH